MKHITNTIVFSFLIIGLFSCEKDKETETIKPPVVAIEDKIPQVFINTNGLEIVDEPKINAKITIEVKGEIDYTGPIGIEIRGASSQNFPKKQFGFETRDQANEDIDVSLLNFPEEEDWILHAPYLDGSLMRNKLIYDLSRDIGRYASRAKFVDVIINESYNGVYLLLEKLKRDKNRIDINKLKKSENDGKDLTGGYILKIDKADRPNDRLYTSANSIASKYAPKNSASGQKIHFLYDTPDEEDITEEQKTYISDYLASFEKALASDDFRDPDVGYAEYINTKSFIDFFLLNELSNNVDGYRLSTRLVKDKSEKLKMGPIWDFNLAFGNANYCGGEKTNVWAYKFNERCSNDTWQVPFWWDRLLQDPAFVLKLKERWVELRSNQFSNVIISQKIEGYSETLLASNSIEENFKKWPSYLAHEVEKKQLMNWINKRLNWLDSEISNL